MQLGAVIVYVEDVGVAVGFYERAFELERGGVSTDEYSELKAGSETVLAFAARSFIEQQTPDHGQPPQRRRLDGAAQEGRAGSAGASREDRFEVVLVADDVQAAFDRAVAAGAEPVLAPEQKPWGQIVSYVRDPDGTLVELCSEWRS